MYEGRVTTEGIFLFLYKPIIINLRVNREESAGVMPTLHEEIKHAYIEQEHNQENNTCTRRRKNEQHEEKKGEKGERGKSGERANQL